MKLRMSQNSLFAILLRSPWWASFAVAAGTFALARLAVPAVYAAFVPLPFVLIGCYAAWRQLRAPSASRIAGEVDSVRAMAWGNFAAAIEAGFRRDGYDVERLDAPGADLVISRGGRRALVACKRWKAARTGIEPLRELDAARRARDADECVYVFAGDITDNARAFAAEKRIRLVHGADLARLVRPSVRAARRA